MQRAWLFSCEKFTVRVVTDENGIIVDAAPIVRKFIGQPFINLQRWQRVHNLYELASRECNS